jgi:hypothetical protein
VLYPSCFSGCCCCREHSSGGGGAVALPLSCCCRDTCTAVAAAVQVMVTVADLVDGEARCCTHPASRAAASVVDAAAAGVVPLHSLSAAAAANAYAQRWRRQCKGWWHWHT